MDALKAFFRKYNAIPATDAGPAWSQATEDVLIGWFDTYYGMPNRSAPAQKLYDDVVAEIRRRAYMPNCSDAIAHRFVNKILIEKK